MWSRPLPAALISPDRLSTHIRKFYLTLVMNPGAKRSIFRWLHVIFGLPIVGYIYTPFEAIPNFAPVVRYVAVPVIVLSGFWLWKGDALRRLVSKKSA